MSYPGWGEEFHVRSWQVEDGLPEGLVTALQQTPDGYLWIGTPQGLVSFDGAQFKMLDRAHTPAFNDARVASLLADHAGALWIGCESGDLLRYHHGRFQTFNPAMRSARLATAGFVQGRHCGPGGFDPLDVEPGRRPCSGPGRRCLAGGRGRRSARFLDDRGPSSPPRTDCRPRMSIDSPATRRARSGSRLAWGCIATVMANGSLLKTPLL